MAARATRVSFRSGGVDCAGRLYWPAEPRGGKLACLVMGLKSHGASTLAGAECLEAAYPGLLERFAALSAPDKAGKKGEAEVEDETEEDEE